MQVDILNGVTVRAEGAPTQRPQPLVAAAILVLAHAGQYVTADTLKRTLWEDWADADRSASLKTLISRMRKVLGDRLAGDHTRWRLDLRAGDRLDLQVFRTLVDKAAQFGDADPVTAAGLYGYAMDVWRGMPADLPDTIEMAVIRDQLCGERLVTIEAMAEVQLVAAQHNKVALALPPRVTAYPRREHMLGLLMRALYGAGRKPEALDLYRRHRAALLEETGSEPGGHLQTVYRRIDDNDPIYEMRPVPVSESDAAVLATLTKPSDQYKISTPRMTNWLMGKHQNLPVDRIATEILLAVAPEVAQLNWESEKLAGRVVRLLLQRGVEHFVSVGSSLPTQYSGERVASLVAPGVARFVHTSNDHSVVKLYRDHLRVDPPDVPVDVAWAELAEPSTILDEPCVAAMIATGKPMLISIREEVNYTPNAGKLLAEIIEAVPAGSYLLMTLPTADGMTDLVKAQLNAVYAGTDLKLLLRTKAEAQALYAGLVIEEFDDVSALLTDRAPDLGPFRSYGGLGYKPPLTPR